MRRNLGFVRSNLGLGRVSRDRGEVSRNFEEKSHKVEGGRIISYRVFVAGNPCDIVVSSRSNMGWIGAGEYQGKRIEVSAASAIDAAEAWVKAAEKSVAVD